MKTAVLDEVVVEGSLSESPDQTSILHFKVGQNGVFKINHDPEGYEILYEHRRIVVHKPLMVVSSLSKLAKEKKMPLEIIECEIVPVGEFLNYAHPCGTQYRIDTAPSLPGFIGFKYANGKVYPHIRLYRSLIGGGIGYAKSVNVDNLGVVFDVEVPIRVVIKAP